VATGLELHRREDPGAAQCEHDFLEAALLRRRHVHRFERPAHARGVALVDRVEVAGEQRRLFAAGAGADLDDAIAAVVTLVGEQVVDQLGRSRGFARLELRQLGAGELGEVAVRALAQGTVLGDLRLQLQERLVARHDRRRLAEFLLQGGEAVGTLEHLRISGLREQFLHARNHAVEALLDLRSQRGHQRPALRRMRPDFGSRSANAAAERQEGVGRRGSTPATYAFAPSLPLP
jgi:hypothetical protein